MNMMKIKRIFVVFAAIAGLALAVAGTSYAQAPLPLPDSIAAPPVLPNNGQDGTFRPVVPGAPGSSAGASSGNSTPVIPQVQPSFPPATSSAPQSSVQSEIDRQAQGIYPELERGIGLSLGAIQRAWDAPYASRGQVSPGIVRYMWKPNHVMAIRTREFMATTVHLPQFDTINRVVVGDPVIFEVQTVRPNVIAVRPTHAGADSNITIIGTSGNVYSFYIRSEGHNSINVADITVYVDASSGGVGGANYGILDPARNLSGAGGSVAQVDRALSSYTGQIPSYIREVMFDPENIDFDMKILASTPEDTAIAPLRVFNDGVWTYFDYGDKADTVRRPVVYHVVDDVDTLVNTRTVGPSGNIVIAEAVGGFHLT